MADKDKFADEVMSDEELDGVAGGSCYDTADDSRFLNSLNGLTDRYGATRLAFEDHDDEIKKAWETVGIKADIYSGIGKIDNKYYLNGQQITQEQARQHAMNVTGHHMTESDWKW